MSLGSRRTFLPSGILMHWAIWHNRYGPKIGGCTPLGKGDPSPHLTQCGQCRVLPACRVSSWSVQPFGHNTPTLQTGQNRQDRQTTVR